MGFYLELGLFTISVVIIVGSYKLLLWLADNKKF